MKVRKRSNSKHVSERSVLDMTGAEARAFLLKSESYCRIDLPVYFQFDKMLCIVSKKMKDTPLAKISNNTRQHEGVNYSLLSNKDGRHAWRPLQLIHPVLYVSLINEITRRHQWNVIRNRFKEFRALPCFTCLSIPVQSLTKNKNKAAQIHQWWQGIEQNSIELAMEYEYVFHADIADCYASIYTHSIAWSVHGRDVAKERRTDKTLIGNIIDRHIQDMRNGQTNGLPQGSVLMDFIAEMLLGYADLELSNRLAEKDIKNYRVLRYRDDYRIFVNNPQEGEVILKSLTEVLIKLGLKLNTSKTKSSQSVVSSSLKPDKQAWLRGRQGDENLQKHLLVIHAHGIDYPNAGSLVVALTHFHQRLSKVKKVQNPCVLISIAVDIAYNSPRTFPVCAAIVSKLLNSLKTKNEKANVVKTIYNKLSQLPNTGLMEVWLQRIGHYYAAQPIYTENLCKLVDNKRVDVWNNDWITSKTLKLALNPLAIVNRKKLRALKAVIQPTEIIMFASEQY